MATSECKRCKGYGFHGPQWYRCGACEGGKVPLPDDFPRPLGVTPEAAAPSMIETETNEVGC